MTACICNHTVEEVEAASMPWHRKGCPADVVEQYPRHCDRLRSAADRASDLASELSYAAFVAERGDSTEVAMRRAFSELEQIGRMLNQAAEAQWWGHLCLGIDVRLPKTT